MAEKDVNESRYVLQRIESLQAEMMEHVNGVKQRMEAYAEDLREEMRRKNEGPAMLSELSFEASADAENSSFVRQAFETVIVFIQV